MPKYDFRVEDVSVEALFNKLGGVENARRLLRGELEVVEKRLEEFVLEIDYDLPLSKAIEAGKYDWKNDCVVLERRLDKPAFAGAHRRKLVLVHLDRNVSTEQAEAEIKARKLRPASIEELLAFGANRPEDQRRFPIVAFGSRFRDGDGDEYVPYLNQSDFGRGLDLDWIGFDWDGNCRFLCVCE